MHYYLWIPFFLILITTVILGYIFVSYLYFYNKTRLNYWNLNKIDIINHPINDIFLKNKFVNQLMYKIVERLNYLTTELKNQKQDQNELLMQQQKLIKKIDFIKWNAVNKIINKNQIIIDNYLNEYNQLSSLFWKHYNELDYHEIKVYVINEKLSQINNDFIFNQNKINNFNFTKAEQKIIYYFNVLEQIKKTQDFRKYNQILNQMIHLIQNKIHLIDNISNAIQGQKNIWKTIDLINLRIKNNSFLKQERIDFINHQVFEIKKQLDVNFIELLNNSKFVDFNKDYLKPFIEKTQDLLNEVTQTKKSHEIFIKYRNKFISDFDFVKIKLLHIFDFINKFNQKTNNLDFLDFKQTFNAFNQSIQNLKLMQINDAEIAESISFIKKTHLFYLHLNQSIFSFKLFVKQINHEITIFNQINQLMYNAKNKYFEINDFVKQNDISLDFELIKLLDFDFNFLIEYEQVIHNQRKNSIITSKEEMIENLNNINERFDMMIEYINKLYVEIKLIHTNLVNKAFYFEISANDIINKFNLENIDDTQLIKNKINALSNTINSKKKNWIG